MKLNQIVLHHRDNRTDQLYQPLRKAIHTFQTPQPHSPNPPTHLFRSDLKRSYMNSTAIQPHLIKQTTLIPQNMRLVQTNNPLKRFKARSRSYRAISVEERVGTPIKGGLAKETIMPVRAATKKEIVYDYQPGEYQPKAYHQTAPIIAHNTEYRLPARTRSVTYLPIVQNQTIRVQERQLQTMKNSIQDNKQSSYPSTKASMQFIQQAEQKAKKAKLQVKEISGSDYYQNTKRYTFDKKMKTLGREQKDGSGRAQVSPRNSNYKYNLFNMLDQQGNMNCNSCCTKNQVVSPRIKQRW